MYTVNKVIWQDGMFIYPHHFQQQDIYYESLLSEYYILRDSYGFGILTFEIDYTCLKLNKIVIKQCIGVFPNGTLFNIPHRDSIPLAIDIPKNYTNKLIYLGLPIGHLCNLNPGLKKPYFRYCATEHECIDTSAESDEKKIVTVGKLNLSLLLENDEYKDQFILLPLLKIADSYDGIRIEENYIPPCLHIKAANILQGYINRILGSLNNYLSLNVSFVQGEKEQQINQLENLLILQTVNKYKYLFEVISNDAMLTPYLLFKNIISLIASITVFTKDYRLSQVNTKYDHSDLAGSFEALMNLLTSIFDKLNESIAIEMTFNPEEDGTYSLNMSNLLSGRNSDMIIGMEFTKKDLEKERANIVNSIKIASIHSIKQVVALQVSGINVSILSSLPYHIPYSDKALYFKIDQDGTLWNQIIENKDMAIHINSEVTEVKTIKLWLIPQM